MTIQRSYIFLASIMYFLASCQGNEYPYSIVKRVDGVLIESFDKNITDDTRYTQSNTVYKAGNRYVFDYIHVTKNGDFLLFDAQPRTKNWEFCAFKNMSDNTVFKIEMTVDSGMRGMGEMFPEYHQTIVQYDYLRYLDSSFLLREMPGVVDNEMNIWMHPPRSGYFKILELNPFPYIRAPFEVGNKWHWVLTIGSHYGDERWKKWYFNTTNAYTYEITDISNRNTAFGDIECYEITSTGTGELGETKLVSWFNFEYGFVKLDYTNIDSSKTIINLTEFEKGSPSTY